MMAVALVSVAAGLLVLFWLDAPHALFALVVSMVAGLVVTLAVTSFWKISIHAAVAAGTVASLVVLVSPWWLLLAPLVVLTGWARVEIRDHTPVRCWWARLSARPWRQASCCSWPERWRP